MRKRTLNEQENKMKMSWDGEKKIKWEGNGERKKWNDIKEKKVKWRRWMESGRR